MGKSQEHKYGGFAAENAGTIENCYACTTVKGNIQAAGFVSTNRGEVSKCYSTGKVKQHKSTGGFSADNQGQISSCYFDKEAVKGKEPLDFALGLDREQLSREEFLKENGWDFENVWKVDGGQESSCPEFRKTTGLKEEAAGKWVHITSKEELLEAAGKISQGDLNACKGNYILESDLDLGGMKWKPLGNHLTPFEGKFDGGGHCIRNFKVVGKNEEFAGFFGYLQNAEVKNLGVDCIVNGGSVVGTLAGMNAHGVIESCYARCKVKGKTNAGGLVGRNTGTIRQCFAAGEVSGSMMCLPFFGGGLLVSKAMLAGIGVILLVAGGITAALLLRTEPVENQVVSYPPVAVDPDVSEDTKDTKKPSNKGNSVSFEFDKEIELSGKDGKASFHFKNPGDSNHNIVVQLQMTDQELIKAIGSTGRLKEEQEKLETQKGYDPETSRAVLAQSGAVPPKYALDSLQINALPNGEKLPKGTYNAVIYLLFYDIKTNERALVNTQMPVKLVVK